MFSHVKKYQNEIKNTNLLEVFFITGQIKENPVKIGMFVWF